MSSMWVAVTAEYDGSTFSHRAQSPVEITKKYRALWAYNRLLDEAGTCVRNGLAGWVPPQDELPGIIRLSEHEKLRAIEKIMTDYNDDEALVAIEAVLKR